MLMLVSGPLVATGSWHYLIHDSSTISINNDTTSRVLPIEAKTSYTVSIANTGNTLVLTAHVDSLFVNGKLSTQNADTENSSKFRSILSNHGQLESHPGDTRMLCTGAVTSASSRISEITTAFPTSAARVGDKWADTISIRSCHGKIPLEQHAIRQFELIDYSSCEQHDGVKVRRDVTNTFTGASDETSSNRLSANGSGTASSILCLQRDTGILLESRGQSHLELTITTSRGTFPSTQNTTTNIELK
jgi:hypothetical protein